MTDSTIKQKNTQRRQRGITIISIILSVLGLAYLISGIDVDAFWNAIQEANTLYFIGSLAIVILLTAIQGWRTWVLLNRDCQLSTAMNSLFLGNFASMLLPLRLGELLRVALLRQKDDVQIATGLSMVFLSQLMDVAGLLLIGATLFVLTPALREYLPMLIALSVVVIIAVIVLLLLTRATSWSFIQRYPRIQTFIKQIARGLQTLHNMEGLVVSVLLTLLYWVGLALSTWLMMIGLVDDLIFTIAIAITVAGGVGRILPALPGSIGTLDFSILVALQIYGVEHNVALVVVILIRLRYLLMTTIIGLGALFYENLSMGQLIELNERTRAEMVKDQASTTE